MIPNADVCVVSGDVMQGCGNLIRWLDRMVGAAMPVVFVAGNHEFYQDSVMEGLEWAKVHAAECQNVNFLENGETVIGGVRFLGCTMWTDYALDGPGRQERAWAMANAEGRLNDHSVIAWRMLPRYESFTPLKALDLYERSREWLRRKLAEPFDGQTVVMTHHAPHPLSINQRWKGSSLNPAFASDLSEKTTSSRSRPPSPIGSRCAHSIPGRRRAPFRRRSGSASRRSAPSRTGGTRRNSVPACRSRP